MSLSPNPDALQNLEQEAVAALFTIEELIHARERLGTEDAAAVARGTMAGALSFLQAHACNAGVRTSLLSALKACDARAARENQLTEVMR